MSIDWKCPECGYVTRLASEMVRVLRDYPLLKERLPGYVCYGCAAAYEARYVLEPIA